MAQPAEAVIPHRWDGGQWACLHCGAVRPDPCDCPCHVYRVLVTGSRNWPDPRKIFTELARFHGVRERIIVVHGHNRNGTDRFAHSSALALGFEREPHPANWGAYKKRAGFIRNAEMVAEGADVCLAFIAPCIKTRCTKPRPHPSHGVTQCAGLAEEAGIEVRRFFGGCDALAGAQPQLLQQPRLPLQDL